MSSGAGSRAAAPPLGASGGRAARRPPASPELLRCSRRRRPCADGAGGGAAAVARRNERERNRVKLVNLGFQALRQHVPRGGAGRKLSKVETLRSAVAYIGALQRLLAGHDSLAGGLPSPPGPPEPPEGAASPSCASSSPGGGGSSEPGSPRSAFSSDDSGCEGALSPGERELLDLSRWWGGC